MSLENFQQIVMDLDLYQLSILYDGTLCVGWVVDESFVDSYWMLRDLTVFVEHVENSVELDENLVEMKVTSVEFLGSCQDSSWMVNG